MPIKVTPEHYPAAPAPQSGMHMRSPNGRSARGPQNSTPGGVPISSTTPIPGAILFLFRYLGAHSGPGGQQQPLTLTLPLRPALLQDLYAPSLWLATYFFVRGAGAFLGLSDLRLCPEMLWLCSVVKRFGGHEHETPQSTAAVGRYPRVIPASK